MYLDCQFLSCCLRFPPKGSHQSVVSGQCSQSVCAVSAVSLVVAKVLCSKTKRSMSAISKKNILYVGGLDGQVTEEILHAAFIPFGELKSIQIPKDFKASEFPFHLI
jgi:hypothetical protein